jgi:F-type H+-transporting ATPase subunit delta
MGLFAKRYVRALYEFATENGEGSRVLKHMKHIRKAFQTHRELQSVLENPVVSVDEKKKLLLHSTTDEISASMTSFLDVLATNKRLTELVWIAHEFIDYYNEKNNIHEVKLTTAVAADDSVHQKTLEWLEKELHGTVEVTYIHNPQIMGGFILDVGCNRWDASVNTTLNEIRKSLTK